ncbi:MAG TPA: 30S ribosomal protein S8 [Candidatus Omnitrophica bacterium]|nr:30S ribosomal protein S8 [Candidatus Omnitrophota bacterium]
MKHHNLISDTLTIIRNANSAGKNKADVPASKMIGSILDILKKENYIEDFKPLEEEGARHFRIYLKFDSTMDPAITGLKYISKPSRRVYVNSTKLPRVLRGQGIAIVSTSRGMLTDQEAREAKIGGEIICHVW